MIKINYKSNFSVIVIAGVLLLFTSFISGSANANPGESGFEYSGFVKGKIEGTADFNYMKRINIWNLSMGSYERKTRASYYVRIFFSRDFTPKTGKFPIKFSYLNKKNTCGGSFIFRNKDKGEKGFFSKDTDGTLTFDKFSEKVEGSFTMKVKNRIGKEINISGKFKLDRGEAFK